MINYITRDIASLLKGEGMIYHGCNCVGGFGSGVAGAIRRKWYSVYEAFCVNGVGEHLLGKIDVIVGGDRPIVVNAYTQISCGRDGRRYADPAAIEESFTSTLEYADAHYVQDIYMPKVGCGLGGLSWEDEVLPIVEKVSSAFPNLNIYICDV